MEINKKKLDAETIRSITGTVLRILLIGCICAAVIFISGKLEDRKEVLFDQSEGDTQAVSSTGGEKGQSALDEDPHFKACYVMICNAPESGIKTTDVPSEDGAIRSRLTNGELVWAEKKGTYNDVSFYQLEDNSYLIDEDEYVLEIKSYTKMSGYVIVTYVSATGVRLRSWADFDDDNIVRSAFVGDKVGIAAKLVTEDDEEVYETTDGLFMTTDSQYFDDMTTAYNGSYEEAATTQEESTTTEQ